MKPIEPNWFIDIRHLSSPEKISLDLSRHLPRRAAVGAVAILAERPAVMLSVIKKRWSILIREVERQYSSTLQSDKKAGLLKELERLRSYTFAIAEKRTTSTHILVAQPEDLRFEDRFATMYLTLPLRHEQLIPLLAHLKPHGFLVTYTGWPAKPSD